MRALEFTGLHHLQRGAEGRFVCVDIGAKLGHGRRKRVQFILLLHKCAQRCQVRLGIVVASPTLFEGTRLLNRHKVNEVDSGVENVALEGGRKLLGWDKTLRVGGLAA